MKEKQKPHLRQIVNRVPLEKFIPAAFLIFLLLFIILSAIIYNSINEYRSISSSIYNTQRIIDIIDDINLILVKTQLDRRGYIITSDNKYLLDYYSHKNLVNERFNELRALVKNKSEIYAFINQMDSLSEESISLLDSSISSFEATKQIDQRLQSDLVMQSQGFLDRLSILSNDMKDIETRKISHEQEIAGNNFRNSQIFIIITSLFVFIVLGASMFISTRLIRNKNIAEKLLRKSYDELEDKVEERTSELRTVNESLVNEINNRIRIETALRESEERFRQLADSAPVLIWMSNTEKKCTYLNKRWLDFTGKTMEEELGDGYIEGIHSDDMQRVLNIYEDAFDKRKPFEMEYRLRNSSGEYRWIMDRGIPRYEGNIFAGYIGSCIDIHDKKRTERYLKLQYSVSKSLAEARTLKEAFNKSLEGICSELGWQMGLIWKVSSNKLHLGGSWAEKPELLDKYLELYDENYTFEMGIGLPGRVWKSNTSQWVQNLENDPNIPRKQGLLKIGMRSVLGIPISDNNKVIAVVECFNKSELLPKYDLLTVLESAGRQIGNFLERKKIEEQLKDSYNELENRVKERTVELATTLNKLLKEIEEKELVQNRLKLFAHAIRGVKECIFITDLNNNTLFVNSAFENIFGYFEEELLNKKIPVLFSGIVEDSLRNEILQSSVRGGWKGELKSRRKDNSEFFIHLSTTVIRNDEGKVQAIVGICQDITETKAQKELLEKRYGLLTLLNDVIAVVNRSFNLEASISYAINKMCEYTSWDAGHCFLVKDNKLVSSRIWNANLPGKFLEFRHFTEQIEFGKNEGMPGECYEKNMAYWVKINTLLNETKYKRASISKKLGIKTGVWAPIKKGNTVVGVLEFFNAEEKDKDDEVLDSICNIGVEIGSLFERNEILEKIKESEENLRLIFENVKDYAIIRLDSKGNIISWNKGAEEIKGYKADEILGRHFSIFYTPDEIAEDEPSYNLNMARKLGRFTREGWRQRKDGSQFWADIIITALKDENEEVIGFIKVTRDATERKKAEEAILINEKKLKEAQKIARLGSWEWDIVSGKVDWSDEMFNIYELNRNKFIPTYESFLSRLHPDDVEFVKKQIETAIKNKQPFDFYERILTNDGKVRILHSQGSVKTDSSGNVVMLIGTCHDVTEVKKAEEVIVQSEKRLREAQKIARLGSWEWDAVLDKVTWSDEMYAIFEVEPGTVITNQKYLELIGETSRETRKEAILKAINENKPFNYYLRIKTKSGKEKILNSIGEVYTDENKNIKRMVGTIIDVTEIKMAEEAILRSEKQLKDAQKIARLGSWEVKLDTNETTWSEEMYRIFCVENDSGPKPYDELKKMFHPDDVEHVDKSLEELYKNFSDTQLDYRIITPDGTLKYLTSDIRVEFDSGKPVRLYGSTQDITDIKLVEEELRRTNARLIEAQKELIHSEKLAALGRFSSGIAHEIRNPLANISALAQLLSKSKIEDEKTKKHLKYILLNSDIANNIIKQLLHFASPEDLVFTSENFAEILENIINSIEPRCAANKILITKQVNITSKQMLLDKTKLENALLNFLSNSIDAMPEGGNLSVKANEDKLKHEVIIDIIDTGLGIPAENLDKIFEPFFTTKQSGTGLGLGLAYQTIKLHHGLLNISSEPGKGTHVEIKLPIRNTLNGKNSNNR